MNSGRKKKNLFYFVVVVVVRYCCVFRTKHSGLSVFAIITNREYIHAFYATFSFGQSFIYELCFIEAYFIYGDTEQ